MQDTTEAPKLRRELSIWEAIGISLALMAPSMAASTSAGKRRISSSNQSAVGSRLMVNSISSPGITCQNSISVM